MRPASHHGRRGMSLLEVMVAIAILLVASVVLIAGRSRVFQMDHRKAAHGLAVLYERLQDEAVMRNHTYRIVFFMNENRYVVEAGEPGALIAADPTARQQYEQEVVNKLDRMDEEEKRRWLQKNKQPFESLGEGRKEVSLPPGMVFGGIYTPQYGEMVVPDGEDDEERKQRVESYVMSNGYSEHTVIWLVDEDDPTDGYSIEIEPLTGRVKLHGELVEWNNRFSFVPTEGPDLPL